MTPEHCILACGRDATLLDTRRSVLESAGYRVRTAVDAPAAIQILLDEKIDLTILCHTLSPAECLATLAAVHASHPEAKTIGLYANKTPCGTETGVEVFNIFEGPEKLLLKVQELVH